MNAGSAMNRTVSVGDPGLVPVVGVEPVAGRLFAGVIETETVGRRGWTRTSDHLLRRQVLYPPELRAHSMSYRLVDAFSESLTFSGFLSSHILIVA